MRKDMVEQFEESTPQFCSTSLSLSPLKIMETNQNKQNKNI